MAQRSQVDQFSPQVEPAAQPRCVGLATAPQFAAQVDRRAERCWRHNADPETMEPQAVVQTQIDMSEHQWRRSARLIDPGHLGVVNLDQRLMQHPIAESALIGVVVETKTSDRNMPRTITPDGQRRGLDRELVQAQAEQHHRAPGQHGVRPPEFEGRPILPVEHDDAGQGQARPIAAPFALDAGNGDVLPGRIGDRVFDPGPVAVDIRQYVVAERQHPDGKDGSADQHQPGQCPIYPQRGVRYSVDMMRSEQADGSGRSAGGRKPTPYNRRCVAAGPGNRGGVRSTRSGIGQK